MKGLGKLQTTYREMANAKIVDTRFAKRNDTLTTKTSRNVYQSSAKLIGDILHLSGAIKRGAPDTWTLSFHFGYWCQFAKLNGIKVIQIDSNSRFIADRYVTRAVVESLDFSLHTERLKDTTYYIVYEQSETSDSFFYTYQTFHKWVGPFLENNTTASISWIRKHYWGVPSVTFAWHGARTSMPIVIQDQKLTLLGEITGECDTAEQLFQKAAKKIESKTRLTNLMSPTYVHLENFLSKINQHSVHYASKIADKLKEIGYSDDQIEEVAIKHLREDSAKPLFNRYDKITGFLEQFVYQSHCFYFGNHVVHMCVSRFNSRNTHITVASSLDEWKEKLEILFHQMISEQLATVTFES